MAILKIKTPPKKFSCEPPHKYGASYHTYSAHLRNMVKPPQTYGEPTSEWWCQNLRNIFHMVQSYHPVQLIVHLFALVNPRIIRLNSSLQHIQLQRYL